MTSIECPGLFAADDSLIKLNWISDGQTTANRSSLAAGISHTNHMSSRVWKILAAVACFPSCAVMGQQPQILSRFGGWAIVRSGDLISLSSDSGNIGVGCGDSTMPSSPAAAIAIRTKDDGSKVACPPTVFRSSLLQKGESLGWKWSSSSRVWRAELSGGSFTGNGRRTGTRSNRSNVLGVGP